MPRADGLRQADRAEWRGACLIHGGTGDNFAVDSATGRWHCHSKCARGGDILELEMALTGARFPEAKAAVFSLVGRAPEPRPESRKEEPWRPVAEYTYQDEAGRTLFQAVRQERGTPTREKRFRQRRPDGKGSWGWDLKDVRLVPYRLPEVLASTGPVYITEGEKDVHTLEAFGLVASCNPMGAGKWRPEYSSHFGGRDVVILPDNDEPGRKHARAVAQALLPVAQSVRLVELPGLPPKGDVSDWVAAGGTREALEVLVADAALFKLPDTPREPDSPARAFPFFQTVDGWYYRNPDAANPGDVRLSGRFDVVAATCDERSENHGRLLEWTDERGHPHSWACPLSSFAGDGNEVRERLLDGGLLLEPSRRARERLAVLIQQHPVTSWIRSVARTGWHGGVFVTPEECIGRDGHERTVYQGQGTGHSFRTAGTLEDWQNTIGRNCAGNSRLVLAVSVALAGPLLEPLGEQSGGFHLVGTTSTGKSTALYVGGSVWGGGSNGFVRNWSTTANGLEATAELHNDCALFLDELHSANPKAVVEMVYALGNGAGRARMTRGLTARRVTTWRVLFLSTGELTLEAHAAKAGERPPGGAEVRLLNVPADAGAGMGLFENLNGTADARTFADQLRAAALTTYGTAGRAFLRYLVDHRDEAAEMVRALCRNFVRVESPGGAASEVGRACQRFALIGAAGELATQAGITGWDAGEAEHAAGVCFRGWLAMRETPGSIDTERGVAQVRAFLEKHGASRFQSVKPLVKGDGVTEERVIDRAGYKRTDSDETEFLIFKEAFRASVCAGLDHKAVLAELEKRGFLRRQHPHWTIRTRTPDGMKDLYCIRGEVLS